MRRKRHLDALAETRFRVDVRALFEAQQRAALSGDRAALGEAARHAERLLGDR